MVKVGDRVELVKSIAFPAFKAGKTGRVNLINKGEYNPIFVKFDDGLQFNFGVNEIKKVVEEPNMKNLITQVEQWSKEKGLDQAEPTKQFLKVSEEFGEIGAALARGNEADFKDAVGDTVVTLIILAQQKGYTLEECLQVAYAEISGRTGQMVDGVFVKSEDLEGAGE